MKGLLILFLFVAHYGFGQVHMLFGVECSPSYGMSVQRNSDNGLLSSKNAFGGNVGFPLRVEWSKDRIFNSGVSFEYVKFNESIRDSAGGPSHSGMLNVPMMLGMGLSGNAHFMIGGGLRYSLFHDVYVEGEYTNSNSTTKRFQPYLGVGISNNIFVKKGFLEVGLQSRFGIRDMLNKITSNQIGKTNNLLSFDLTLRWYIAGVRHKHLYHFFKVM